MSTALSICLWFDTQAEEAAEFYTSVVPNSSIRTTNRYPDGLPAEPGSVMAVSCILDGVGFTLLNGGPVFQFTPAASIVLSTETQAETDRLWVALTEGGEEGQCGWLIDRFGVSWQVVPKGVDEMLGSPDREAANRAVQAMLPMKKLDVAAMRRAFDGE